MNARARFLSLDCSHGRVGRCAECDAARFANGLKLIRALDACIPLAIKNMRFDNLRFCNSAGLMAPVSRSLESAQAPQPNAFEGHLSRDPRIQHGSKIVSDVPLQGSAR